MKLRTTTLRLALSLSFLPPLAAAQGSAPPAASAHGSRDISRTPFMSWQHVGDPGNPGSSHGDGSVAWEFLIGKYEVTNEQYAELLNAKAALGDPLALYNPAMTTNRRGGIVRTGSGTPQDPHRYEPKDHMGQKPVNYVSFYDAMRFSNWMHNGRGSGDTELGSYVLVGGTPEPTNGTTVVRNPAATVVVPTEHEWYKAGHYNPNTTGYSIYATGSSVVPTPALATSVGDVANAGPNVVNYLSSASWAGQSGNVTTVGSAGSWSEGHYGCADMNGNVSEWTETRFNWQGNPYRKNLGGNYFLDESIMQPGHFGIVVPYHETSSIGFRVARRLP